MTKLTELRVGNFFDYEGDALPILKIDGDAKKIYLDLLIGLNIELSEEDLTPISLTPEWLDRCGFEDHSDDCWIGPEISNSDSTDWFRIDKQKDGGFMFFDSEWTHGRTFFYLHQLQNLYFALIGKELTIKEKNSI